MSSGKKQRVLICCLSPFHQLYMEPMSHYDPDRVYMFIDSGEDIVSEFQSDLYGKQKSMIECNDIVELTVDTHSFESVLGSIFDIKTQLMEEFGRDLELYINISSGTKEFAAAGMLASMTKQRCVAFRVKIDLDMSREALQRLISGVDMTVSEPDRIEFSDKTDPDERMTIFLAVLRDLAAERYTMSYRKILNELKERGGWTYDPDNKANGKRTTQEQKEKMYLVRSYIKPALNNGWIECRSKGVYSLTDLGTSYLSVYDRRKLRLLSACSYSDYESADPVPNYSAKELLELDTLDWDDSDYLTSPLPPEEEIEVDYIEEVPAEEGPIEFVHGGRTYRLNIDVE